MTDNDVTDDDAIHDDALEGLGSGWRHEEAVDYDDYLEWAAEQRRASEAASVDRSATGKLEHLGDDGRKVPRDEATSDGS